MPKKTRRYYVNRIVEHWDDNKATYYVGAIALAAIALQQYNLKSFYKFLETKDIDPMEFYFPEYYHELNP